MNGFHDLSIPFEACTDRQLVQEQLWSIWKTGWKLYCTKGAGLCSAKYAFPFIFLKSQTFSAQNRKAPFISYLKCQLPLTASDCSFRCCSLSTPKSQKCLSGCVSTVWNTWMEAAWTVESPVPLRQQFRVCRKGSDSALLCLSGVEPRREEIREKLSSKVCVSVPL